ncbi:MAG: 3-dehydroquinate synthase [Gammaproteobacteria bacterium]|nr:MAG: 3-dehydroquinate synthase [Gammaproteobacteria bacterium]
MARAENSLVARSIEESLHWQRFHVPFTYPVYFTEGLLAAGNGVLAQAVARIEPDKRHRCLIFVDDGVVAARPGLCDEIVAYAAHHAERMELVAAPVQVPGGEVIKKDLHFVERMQCALYDNHIDRHSFCIGIGGGAVLDAVGLVAATTHRGVRHIRIPTTVLSQNDSGVGVKNGINLFEQKNFVGTFAPPFAVLNDIAFIDTLAPRDRIAGMAEAVKVGLIRDGKFFAWLERNADALALFERPAMARMIRRCAELHMHQIARGGDPFEVGSARPLDYGHWAAHKLESLTRHHLRHGEAVAIGIALDSRYSVLSGHLRAGEEERICFLLEHLGFKLWHAALDQTAPGGRLAVLQGLQDFREHLGGDLSITLLAGVGTGVEVHRMDEGVILDAVEWLRQRGAG